MESKPVIGKLEPVDPEEMDTVEVHQIKTIPQHVEYIMEEDTIQSDNTDGNLEINAYQESEDTEEGHYSGQTETVVIEQPDGNYIVAEGQIHEETGEMFIAAEDDVHFEVQEGYVSEESAEYVQEAQYTEGDDQEEDGEYEMEDDPDDPNYEDEDKKPLKRAIKVEDGHPCSLCKRTFKTNASLKRHITVAHANESTGHDPLAFEVCQCCGEPSDTAHTNGSIKCEEPECDKLFALQTNLSRHISLEHPDSNDLYKCCECGGSYKTREEIVMHMQSHPLAKPYSCTTCNRDFTRKYHLDRHVQQTGCDGQPRNQFQCKVCNKAFSRKDNLKEHLRAHAGQVKKKKVYPCPYCQKEFQGAALLVVHMRTHTGEKPYNCDLCPKSFPSSGAMKKHRRMHTGEKPYQCMECKRRFAAKETLNRHTRTHTGVKPHKCTYCGKAFIQAAQLRAHIFHHTGENAFTCPHCNRAFNRRVRLTTHMKFVHEGAEPLQCNQCDKTFYRKEDLARHESLHSGEKPYECMICEKRFAVKASLKLHALTHRKEQPCSCDECGRAFIRQDCLMRHMRAKHRDVLEDIMAAAEKKRLQEQLLSVTESSENKEVLESDIWNEMQLTDSIKDLLNLLVDQSTLKSFGWPESPVDKILDSVIRRCGHEPASEEQFDYINRMRENAKLLFTVVIDDQSVKSLLNNQTVDEVIKHVLKLAKGQGDAEEEEVLEEEDVEYVEEEEEDEDDE